MITLAALDKFTRLRGLASLTAAVSGRASMPYVTVQPRFLEECDPDDFEVSSRGWQLQLTTSRVQISLGSSIAALRQQLPGWHDGSNTVKTQDSDAHDRYYFTCHGQTVLPEDEEFVMVCDAWPCVLRVAQSKPSEHQKLRTLPLNSLVRTRWDMLMGGEARIGGCSV